MIDNGENVHTVLEELGFDNVRIRDSILRSAGAGDKLTETIALGTRAWDENIALTREAELRYGTMDKPVEVCQEPPERHGNHHRQRAGSNPGGFR